MQELFMEQKRLTKTDNNIIKIQMAINKKITETGSFQDKIKLSVCVQ